MNKEKYICPMHPEVTSDKPGSCPKCGMPLVAKAMRGKEGMPAPRSHAMHGEVGDPMEHHAMMAEDFKRRFWVALPITLVVLFLSPKIQEWFGFSVDFPLRNFVLFVLGTVIASYGGKPFFAAARDELRSRNYGMMTLVSLAVLTGYFFSVAATFLFPGESLWWEISTLVLVFLFGHWIEMRAVLGTGGALKELAKLIPPVAHLLIEGKKGISGSTVKDVATQELKKGDFVLIKPGEKVPADGVVTEGVSSVNESMITGESKPVEKKEGDTVIGGTINGDGSLTIKITKTGEESALSQIMGLVRSAQETKPSVQKLADKAANYLTLTAIFVGSGTFIYWFFINPAGAIFAATLAITVVVITCPHALGLAIPTVTTITSSIAAKNGILIRDMKGLEIARQLNYIVLDKTGTLTEGDFGVVSTQNGVLELAAALENHSEHSIGKAIVAEAKKKKIKIPEVKNVRAVKGKGIVGEVDGAKIILGNWKFVRQEGDLKTGEVESTGTVIYVLKNGKLIGSITLEDKIRKESKEAISAFHEMNIKVAMLTGDKKEVGEKVGKELGIDTVFSEVLPEDKVGKIKELQEKGYKVAMVGDGVNDAPSLTQANVGIAIGAGTDVAIESAEIVLVKSNPLDIVKVVALSRATDAKMKQNLAWATGYNLLAIPAAAGVFIPWGIILRPEWGALLMSASSIIVVANALLLKKTKF